MISHLDVRFLDDLPAYKELARRGYWLSLDTFGREMYYPHANIQFPSDAQRIQVVLGLLEAGYGDRLLLAQDICFRSDLVRYGGHGYAHLLRTLRSRFLQSGVSAATFDSILTDNPCPLSVRRVVPNGRCSSPPMVPPLRRGDGELSRP